MQLQKELIDGELSVRDQQALNDGFARHTEALHAPAFSKKRLSWKICNEAGALVGALTGDLFWDWLYIDELWVHEELRGTGLGKELVHDAIRWATSNDLVGIWLWTQSWQAADFYTREGFEVFARFPDFPRGHERIGFRLLCSL